MAERQMGCRPNTPFSQWLWDKINGRPEINKTTMADDLHMSRQNLFAQLRGEKKPTFCYVITYCWYFNDGDDPVDIWKLVQEL